MRELVATALIAVVLSIAGGCMAQTGSSALAGPLGALFDPLLFESPGEVANQMFDMSNPDKRRRAVELISAANWGGADEYVRAYRVLLMTDEDDTVRSACLRALGRHGSPEDVLRIVKFLAADQETFIRWEAATALQKIHNSAAIDPLTRTIRQDPDSDVRMAAARALAQYAKPDVVQSLVGVLNDHDFGVAHRAGQSLAILTGQDFGMDASRWFEWSRQHAADLFSERQEYTWQPYEKPRGVLDKAQFWKQPDPVRPRRPTGLEDARATPRL